MELTQSQKPLLLIVEDNLKNIQVLGSILTNHNYDLMIARNGREALTALAKKQPDLILLDIMMPEMDGFTTCEKIKAQNELQNIPIIFLTARTEEDDIAKGFEMGAVDYITKPFGAAELLCRIQTHLELKQNREQLEQKNSEQNQLLHILCHDISNPISSVISLIELVKSSPDDIKQYLDLMNLSLFNCLDSIDLVRKMRSLDEGKMKLTLQSIDLLWAVNNSCSILSHVFNKKELELKINIPEAIYVMVDEVSFITTVLNNLLTNAAKFSYRNNIIEIFCDITTDEVVLNIKDHGIGIPEQLIDNLFSLSKSTSRSGTENEIGTGFGMPLVKKFVDYYGGQIIVTSKDKRTHPCNHGTQVQLHLKKASAPK